MTNRDIDIERLLPLPPAVLHILIALGEGEKHGYAMMREVADRTEGKVRMSPGTLYGSIRAPAFTTAPQSMKHGPWTATPSSTRASGEIQTVDSAPANGGAR